jgi:mRNA interferase MazF
LVRGEVFRLPPRRGARGHEQRGARYAVIVQAEEFFQLSTVLVAPTSTSARPTSFRPTITVGGKETRVLVEQTTVVARPAASMQANYGRSTTPSCSSSAFSA